MPTSAIKTFTGKYVLPVVDVDDLDIIDVALAPSQTIAAGSLLGEVTATPGTYKVYASGNSDGSQNPTLVCQYDCIVDASGNITLSSTAGQSGGPLGETLQYAPAFYEGVFKSQDIPNLDANAISKCGRLLQGSNTNGLFKLY